ncbi:MAG: hypothetical protein WKF47_19835 [Geodermatophilaceae bacterium]
MSPAEPSQDVSPACSRDAALQDVDGRLPWIFVFSEYLAGRQRNQRLPQHVLMSAVHGVRAATARRVLREGELLTGQGRQ